jgi:hypothetical protein
VFAGVLMQVLISPEQMVGSNKQVRAAGRSSSSSSNALDVGQAAIFGSDLQLLQQTQRECQLLLVATGKLFPSAPLSSTFQAPIACRIGFVSV